MLGANFDVLRLAMQSEDLAKIGRKAPCVRASAEQKLDLIGLWLCETPRGVTISVQIRWSKEVVYVQNVWWRAEIELNLVTVVVGGHSA